MNRLLLLLVLPLLAACSSPEGLRETPDGTGPLVTIDWDAEPLPELPFPNDLATRPDPTSPTGLRLNISEVAATHEQSETRAMLNTLSGWGIYQPITVGFEAPIDLQDFYLRHAGDRRVGSEARDDDAIFLIDVTPGSPTYGLAHELDIGHGRFPLDVWDPTRYMPNDTRVGEPSLTFDTVDEDLNGNGVLDFGEDTDNDGNLDFPNVFRPGNTDLASLDPWTDLLEWYERETNTLIVRPAVPLREETTYAVVITERVTDADGSPIRSPWEFVNHTRQTEALRPLITVLPAHGLTIDDVAFAWCYTTGQVTKELVEVRRGIHGEGPLSWMADEVPARIEEALILQDRPGEDPYGVSVGFLIDQLATLGLYEEGGLEATNYSAFGDRIVGGSFTTLDMLNDKDDGGRDDSEEFWVMDLAEGTAVYEPRRVVFTCFLPKPGIAQPPYDVVLFGHGYGSSRFETAAFNWVLNRMGMASCGFDTPGHGLEAGDGDVEDARILLDGLGLGPLLDHLTDSRARDLDNDGSPDSGGDQWSADAFHTRDNTRQAVLDWIQFRKALDGCGTDTMVREGDGSEAMACDWNDDGVPDIGGPDARYFVSGGSLGGIIASVAAPVMVDVEAVAPIVSGGGLLDIAMRSDIGGALEAMAGRLMTPMFYGRPNADGDLEIMQMVISVTHKRDLLVATIPASDIPAGGSVVIENLDNDLRVEGMVPADGRFRVSIAADGLRPADKAILTGMPISGPVGFETYTVPDNEGLGDRMVVTLYDADGAEVAVLDTWEAEVEHEGVTMPAGSPLVAGSYGSGYIRATPELRRVAMVFAAILEPGDPIAYAPRFHLDPFPELGARPANVMHVPSAGDNIVAINTGMAEGRAAGFWSYDEIDDRYGSSVDQWLIDSWVVHGIEDRGPYLCSEGQPCLFDPDDLDDDIDPFGEPSDAPLRATVDTTSGQSGMRVVYGRTGGGHSPGLPDADKPFDVATYMLGSVGTYFMNGGTEIVDDPCLTDLSCAWIPQLPEEEE